MKTETSPANGVSLAKKRRWHISSKALREGEPIEHFLITKIMDVSHYVLDFGLATATEKESPYMFDNRKPLLTNIHGVEMLEGTTLLDAFSPSGKIKEMVEGKENIQLNICYFKNSKENVYAIALIDWNNGGNYLYTPYAIGDTMEKAPYETALQMPFKPINLDISTKRDQNGNLDMAIIRKNEEKVKEKFRISENLIIENFREYINTNAPTLEECKAVEREVYNTILNEAESVSEKNIQDFDKLVIDAMFNPVLKMKVTILENVRNNEVFKTGFADTDLLKAANALKNGLPDGEFLEQYFSKRHSDGWIRIKEILIEMGI